MNELRRDILQIALAMIEAAERDYPLYVVTSDAFAQEKLLKSYRELA